MPKIAIDRILLKWFEIPLSSEVLFFDSQELKNIRLRANNDYLVALHQGSPALFELVSHGKKTTYLIHQIDIDTFIKQQGSSFPASKKNIFSQAIGRKTHHVIDATGGWLGDSLLMCSQNYVVDVIERNWLLQGFIAEACVKLSNTHWAINNGVSIPQLHRANAIDYLQKNTTKADCVYIDPMFPPKVKKSAAVRKSMKVLHDIVGKDVDAEQLFEAAYNNSGVARIVVKRPDYSSPLGELIVAPTETLSGKLVRYDVYLR